MADLSPASSNGIPASITPASEVYDDLTNLPQPKGRIIASVYGFRDQTGQYLPSPASNLSTAVTQGAASMLVKALLDSGWFLLVEREGLQDLLTERKIIRAANKQKGLDNGLPPLEPANMILEGGIIGYDSNVRTGGSGARYFGLGISDQYRVDQVTVGLRAVDIRTGRILKNVFTTKTIFSKQIDSGIHRFVRFKRLLEAEAGYTENEPAQLCVLDAIQAAVIQLIIQGAKENIWQSANEEDLNSPRFRSYITVNGSDSDDSSEPHDSDYSKKGPLGGGATGSKVVEVEISQPFD